MTMYPPAFQSRLLAKHLTRQRIFHRIPRYVVEYLLAKFAPTGGDAEIARVQRLLQDHYLTIDQREHVKDQLLRTGRFVLIDELRVTVDLQQREHSAHLQSLGKIRVNVPFDLPAKYPAVLHGIWGTLTLGYDTARGQAQVTDFQPFQVSAPRLGEFIEARRALTEDRWLTLLLRSVGLEPATMSRRLKLLYLLRLTPLVESNLNLMELGPRQTGKTFLLRNTSPDAFVISGGKATPAALLYNQATRTPGVIPTHEAVLFDEIAHTSWTDPALLSSLKDYMESGQFSRGDQTFQADASLIFMGNADHATQAVHSALPRALARDTAFLDRLHGLIPGFEFPKLTEQHLTSEFGLVTDYLAEIFSALRGEPTQPLLPHLLPANLTTRDRRSIEKVTSALLKLLYPAGDCPEPVQAELQRLATELRQRVQRELHLLNPVEFPQASPA
ncbi:BREX system Lon protease-like protein BrxL [Deinococcus sp. RIT780]|uniref:BREX system Lon protease-like protein BrxL n=1 Tax=Deinococcus sp. RIT780 TaxID=2870472 RepID=UPI001C8A8217|nr:BREX system Lon protease-like protein BrxL [Deinococcus sp. RIT780]MBX8464804.1 BREX system Lon protease-like protein BrxL [Deinococcus sp. RIT780]